MCDCCCCAPEPCLWVGCAHPAQPGWGGGQGDRYPRSLVLSAVGPGHHLSASGSCDVCGPFGSSRAGGGGSQAVMQVGCGCPAQGLVPPVSLGQGYRLPNTMALSPSPPGLCRFLVKPQKRRGFHQTGPSYRVWGIIHISHGDNG